MSVVAQIKDGKVVESASQNSLEKATKSNNGMDKEAFLKLLVAQMQYQDPLEPTSNTEFISQYAQFSQVEQMQNMASTVELQRAASLVGQEVYVKTQNADGKTSYVQGKVDYVVYEGNKAYVAIDESLYSIDDVDTVLDDGYLAAYNKGLDFVSALNKLPHINGVDETDAEKIYELEKIYNEMTDYEKSFIATDVVKTLNKYIQKIKDITGEGSEEDTENKTEGSTTEGDSEE